MNLTPLDTAVSEIKQACDDVGGEAFPSPFFFVVGAGVSVPSVPLAAGIIEDCQEEVRKHKRPEKPEPAQPLDRYSYWFSSAYPQSSERQQYMRSRIESRPISLGNLRLAHLLSGKRVANLVVTTNFDDYLARALRLFGHTPVVCDHPSTVARIDPSRPDVQIVHIHGSYHFYDCLNLRAEVRSRARADRGDSQTVLGFLNTVLWSRSPLVIGYSGWEGDVVMTALRQRLSGGHPLRQNLYWFCYDRKAAGTLPRWLTENTHVRLVVPPDEPSESARPMRTGLGGTTGAGAGERPREVSPRLTAQAVFEKLIEFFGVEEPALFRNPIQHFANVLEAAFLYQEATAVDADPYKLGAVVQLMRDAAARKTETRSDVAAKLEAVRKAIRRPRYRDAIVACAQFVPFRLGDLTPDQRKEVLNAAALAGDGVLNKCESGGEGRIEAGFDKTLAQVCSVDARLEDRVGPLHPGMAVAFPSRPGQMAMDSLTGETPRGAFSSALDHAISQALNSKKQSAKPSFQQLVIDAGTKMLKGPHLQLPVVVGDGGGTSIFLDPRASVAGRAKRRLRALLAGINEYKMGSNLAGCVNDVDAFAKLFEMHEVEFGRPQIKRIVNGHATASVLRKALAELSAAGQTDDVVLFHFSGHLTQSPGQKSQAPGTRDLLVAHDYDGKGAGQILLSEVIAELAKSKAKQKIVILD